MNRLTLTAVMIVLLGWIASASPASAQGTTADPAPRTTRTVEVTPFVSIDSRGSSPLGAAFSFPLGTSFNIETEVGYRRGEGDVNALSSSVSLLYNVPRPGRIAPYLATGVGLAQYGTPVLSGQGAVIGTQPRVAFELNAGGGLKVPVDDTWGLRTDARWYKSFGTSGSEHWRVAQGVSFDTRK